MKTLKIAASVSALCLTMLAGPTAIADFGDCQYAQRKLANAYEGLRAAQSMAQNSVAICGQSASCYTQIAMAVNQSQQAVANAQAEVRRSCHGGGGGHGGGGHGGRGGNGWGR